MEIDLYEWDTVKIFTESESMFPLEFWNVAMYINFDVSSNMIFNWQSLQLFEWFR